jgi:hypothetical protein
MAVYINIKDDESILKLLEKHRSILIIGCSECTNISLAYKKGEKLMIKSNDNFIPYAIYQETERLKYLLEQNGKLVFIEIEKPCELNDKKLYNNSTNRVDIDAILSLSCMVGTLGILKTVGQSISVIAGADTIGLIQPFILYDKDKSIHIDKIKSSVVRGNFESLEGIDLKAYWNELNS